MDSDEFKNALLEESMADPESRVNIAMRVNALRISDSLAQLRAAAGLSQADLADRVGTKQSQISRFENGNYTGFSVRALSKIADALDVELFSALLTHQEANLCRAALRGELVHAQSVQQIYVASKQVLDKASKLLFECQKYEDIKAADTQAANTIVKFPTIKHREAV